MRSTASVLSGLARVLARGGVVLLAVMAISTGAHAQWEATFGGTCAETARKGVTPVLVTPGGGYVFAGESNSPAANCASSDIYITKIPDNPNAALPWSFTYDIGGNDTATCIRECANGDFIVTGLTQITPCQPRDAFLMRLNPNGGVIWVKTYGNILEEGGAAVIETTIGNGPTHPGDFVVAGFATNSARDKDGYLFRVDSNGNLIWDETYKGAPGRFDEIFLSLAEITVGGSGDIVAVGNAVFPGSPQDAFMVRVNGNTGTIGAAPQGASHWGGTMPVGLFEVRELKTPLFAGNLVVTGAAAGPQAGALILEGYVARLSSNPCAAILAQTRIGDGTTAADIAYSVEETPAGNLVVVGRTSIVGLGADDAFLTELSPAALAVVASPPGAGFKVYGGSRSDNFFSVAPVAAVVGGHSAGYIAAGFTESPAIIPLSDPRQAFVVKTDLLGQVGGCELARTPVVGTPTYVPICITPTIIPFTIVCVPPVVATAQTWKTVYCYSGNTTREHGGNGNDGISGVTDANTASPFDETAVSSYPNPVRRGEAFTLGYALTKESDVTISVSDIAGKIIEHRTMTYPAGMNRISMSTDGWAAGAYMITLSANGRNVTQPIVVADR